MAINKSDIEKIIAGVVGVGVVGIGIAALIDRTIDRGEPFTPDENDRNDDDNSLEQDDDDAEYADMTTTEEVLESEIQQEADSMWDEQQTDHIWEQYQNSGFQQGDAVSNYQEVQKEFKEKSNSYRTKYLYLDFTQNLKSGSSRNRNDVYQESITDQFEKIKRKLSLYGRNDITDLKRFVNLCFPMIKSTYYVSLPSFERKIEKSRNYQGADCIYNMVLRPEKAGVISSVIPKELDVILVGDLVFRNNVISFVVKGLDLIDENVEKFGELPVECAAACAITRTSRNLPDYGMDPRNLYNPFLTRDLVLSMCEKVYPIENPERAVEVFEKWQRYVEFRSYFLDVQSQRNEIVQNIEFIRAYSLSRKEYEKNKDIYSQHLLDNNKNFVQREQVLLDEANDDTVEFPLIRVEITRNLAEISRSMSKDKKITVFERDLRRFTRVQVALSQRNPENGGNSDYGKNIIYLGDRVAFEKEDELPDCEDIIQFFDNKIKLVRSQVEDKYSGIIKLSIESYRQKEEAKLDEECQNSIKEYYESLDRMLRITLINL